MLVGSREDIEIDEDVTYSLAAECFNKPLRLTNKSAHIYVFKIKTNQRSVISMQVTHDFIKPNSVKEIVIRLAEKPSESTPLRLELNYVIPTEEEIRINDSKMNSYGRDAVFRRIVTISRDDSVKPASLSASTPVPARKEEVLPEQASINLSAVSLKEEKKEERRDSREARRDEKEIKRDEKEIKREEKEVLRQEKREAVRQEKFQPQLVASIPVKYPDLSYIRQVESEQIEVVTGKSTEIDITGLVQAPLSSEQAISTYSRSIDIAVEAAKTAKTETKPVIKIPSMEREDSFILAHSSASPKKSQIPDKSFKSEDERALSELNEKLEREQATVAKLKNQQAATLRSSCVYPVPIVYLLVLTAFFVGALANWIIL